MSYNATTFHDENIKENIKNFWCGIHTIYRASSFPNNRDTRRQIEKDLQSFPRHL